ncbi:MAG: DUF350 domain-containing protein [Bacteroidota bacterium]
MLENPTVELVVETLLYVGVAFALFLIGRLVFSLTHKNINLKQELVKKDNLAFALSNIGYYIGLLITIGSVIVGPSYGLLIDLVDIVVFGLLAIVLLNLSSVINDKLILRKFSITKEIIEDQNAGTGVVHAANYIASGFIIYGAVYGEGVNFLPDTAGGFLFSGILLALLFWGIGQVVLLITSYVYNMILPYDLHDHIEKDNVAVGIGYAGAIIAIAILISHGTSGDFYGWTDHFLKIGAEVLIGFILLPVVRWITDKVLLPGENITDEIINQEHPNIGAAMIEAFAYIGGAVLITWCL